MDNLEREIQQSLARVDPGADFAARLMARAEAPERRRARIYQWQWAAACVLLCAAVGWPVHHEWRQRQTGLAARAQLMQALRVTATQLQAVKQKVKDTNR